MKNIHMWIIFAYIKINTQLKTAKEAPHCMELTLTATFIQEGPENGFTGWIDEIPGVIAYGDSFEKAKSELMKMLTIKMKLERERAKEAPTE